MTMHLGSPQTPIAMFEPIQSSTVKNRPPEPAPTLRTGRRSRTANSTERFGLRLEWKRKGRPDQGCSSSMECRTGTCELP